MFAFRVLLGILLGGCAAGDTFQSGQLTAADVDDNLNFDWFMRFRRARISDAAESGSEYLPTPYLNDRIPLQVVDAYGAPFSSARVTVQNKTLHAGTDGRLALFPTLDGLSAPYVLTASPAGGTCPNDCVTVEVESVVDGAGDSAAAPSPAAVVENPPALVQVTNLTASPPKQLDLALLVDTTGSMCDEINYLKSELAGILSEQASGVDVRLAYIAFKSEGDSPYAVSVSPFGQTPNFEDKLGNERCSGGLMGELVNKALDEAAKLEWRTGNTARLTLIVGDEPPHGDLQKDMQEAVDAALRLRAQGVRVYGLAASGANRDAEYLFRLISLVTNARYLWLTDDSGIGDPHGEPEVLCYQVTHLDKLLGRVIRSELTGKRVEADPSHIIREVGQQEAGVCMYDLNPDGELTVQTDEASVRSAPSSFADASSADVLDRFLVPLMFLLGVFLLH